VTSGRHRIGEMFGIQVEHTGFTLYRQLRNPRGVSPEADLINEVALWFKEVDHWRERFLTHATLEEVTISDLPAINENLIFLAAELTAVM
jgi:hypothetical protein